MIIKLEFSRDERFGMGGKTVTELECSDTEFFKNGYPKPIDKKQWNLIENIEKEVGYRIIEVAK